MDDPSTSPSRGSAKLTEADLALFQEIQDIARRIRDLMDKIREHNHQMAEKASSEVNAAMLVRLSRSKPAHWENLGEQHLQIGLDSLRRSVTKPIHF